MIRDALIAKRGRYGWRWSVVPLGLLPSFRAHGWINVLNTDEMDEQRSQEIQDVRQQEEQRNPNRPRWWQTGKPRPQTNDE